MKILIVSVVFPYPVDAGGSAGTFKMIDYARQHHDITFLSLYASPEKVKALQMLWPNVDIRVASPHEVDTKPTLLRRIANMIRKPTPATEDPRKKNMVLYSTDISTCYFPQIVKLTEKVCKEKEFDLIQTEFIEFAPLIHFLPKDIPNVHLHHELRFRRMYLEYNLQKKQTIEDKWRIETTKSIELNTLSKYNKVITVSENDAIILRENGLSEDLVVSSPLPVEPARKGVNEPFTFANKLVYLGPQTHYPNYDGVKWFIEEIWPGVKERHPQLTFEIIGNWPSEFKAPFENIKGVSFLGFVKDLKETFEGAIMVVPLRIGGGMRMKILEAISWQIPLITTEAGAEGLPMKHEENALIANDPHTFTEEISKLVLDKQLQQKLIKNAKPVLRESFDIEVCGLRREEIYQSIVP